MSIIKKRKTPRRSADNASENLEAKRAPKADKGQPIQDNLAVSEHDEQLENTAVESDLHEAETTSTPVGNRFVEPRPLRSRRTRKAPKQSQRKAVVVRVPLSLAVVACRDSKEMWVLITKSFNGRFQVEEVILVAEHLQDQLYEHLRPVKMQAILNQDGSHSLLYTKLTDGYENTWMDSAESCSELLEQGWGRVISDRTQQEYVYVPVNNGKPLPATDEFPDLDEMIQQVFADKMVNDLEHPILEEMGIYIDPNQAA